MSWIVEGIIRRDLGERRYSGKDWLQFCTDHRIDVEFLDLPASLPAVVYGNTLLLRRGMDALETAWWAWHELGHIFAHVGNRELWRQMSCGSLILSKQERQANYFALTFPRWPIHDLRELADRLAIEAA